MWNKTLDALKGQAALIYTCILSYILGMYAYMYVLANTCHGLNGTITWMCHQGCELVATGNVLCAAVSPDFLVSDLDRTFLNVECTMLEPLP